jgi:TolB-like protein/DNA-binding winged helix-turn-helix (wHTH) protein/Tfp pilus assembly protein PilF
VDLVSGQVMRQGRRLPLQDQPFRVLSLLLERPGQIVTREELQARLWPADTYIGFDEGLNTAIRKLRVLFGDSADNPRFIETIPRRGYCFIAPVTEIPGGDELSNGSIASAAAEVAAAAHTPANGHPRTAEAPGPRRFGIHLRFGVIIAAAAAVLIFTSVFVIRHSRSRSAVQAHVVKRGMLAVLPFQNLSGDPTQDYFSDGLTEETITDLGQLSPSQLGVIARTSAMAYKHSDKTVGQIGRELGVDYILEGSVRREGKRARISAQLIRVSDQTHLWAQSYDARDLKDLIEVQNALGRAIADQVQLNVASEHPSQEIHPRPINPEAYDLYLQGRFYCNQRTPSSMRQCIELLKKATVVDPDYSQAYSALAFAYDISNIFGILTSKESLPLAKVAANKAIELDSSIAEAYAALGMEKSHYDFDLPGARAEFLKAIDLDPNSAVAHFLYSNCYLTPMGLRAEAIAENKKAIELDPLNLGMNNFLGETYKLAGDYEASYKQFQHTKEMNPNFALPYEYLTSLFEVMAKYEDAINEREKGDALYGWTQKEASDRANALRNAHKRGGEKGYWKEHLAQDIESMKRPGLVFSPTNMAFDYAQGGEKDKAFEWLEKAYDAKEGGELTLLAVDPVWKNLHGDPRFSALLKRIGLPEADLGGR